MKIFEITDKPPRIRLGGFGRQPSKNYTEPFLKDYIEITQEHPFNSKARIYNNAVIEIYSRRNEIHISDVLSTQPRSGAGTAAIKMLKKLADKHNIKLDLTAKSYHTDQKFVTDTETLVRWYRKLGFIIDDEFIDDEEDLEGVEQVDMKYLPN